MIDRDFSLAQRATEIVVSGSAWDGPERRSLALCHPTGRTEVISAELDRKIRKALWRAAYLVAFRLYLRLPGIYFRLILVQLSRPKLKALRYFHGHLADLLYRVHGRPHQQGQDYRS